MRTGIFAPPAEEYFLFTKVSKPIKTLSNDNFSGDVKGFNIIRLLSLILFNDMRILKTISSAYSSCFSIT